MNRETLAIVVGYVVTAVWVVSFLAQILVESYEPSNYVHLALMAVVGSSFGISLIGKKGNGSGNG